MTLLVAVMLHPYFSKFRSKRPKQFRKTTAHDNATRYPTPLPIAAFLRLRTPFRIWIHGHRKVRVCGRPWIDRPAKPHHHRLRPLDDVREQVTVGWRTERLSEALRARAEEFAERLDNGELLAVIADELGLDLQTEGPKTRNDGWTVASPAQVEEIFADEMGGASFAPTPGLPGALTLAVLVGVDAPERETSDDGSVAVEVQALQTVARPPKAASVKDRPGQGQAVAVGEELEHADRQKDTDRKYRALIDLTESERQILEGDEERAGAAFGSRIAPPHTDAF